MAGPWQKHGELLSKDREAGWNRGIEGDHGDATGTVKNLLILGCRGLRSKQVMAPGADVLRHCGDEAFHGRSFYCRGASYCFDF